MESTKNSAVSGVYYDRAGADAAYQAALDRGYSEDDINVLMSEETRDRHYGEDPDDDTAGSHALEGAGAGSMVGGTIGGIIGAIAAIGTSVALPGLGLLIAGPIAGALAGAGAGGATGGLLGALVGAGIPEDRAKQYESHVKEGGMVIDVRPRSDDDATFFEDSFRTGGARDVARY